MENKSKAVAFAALILMEEFNEEIQRDLNKSSLETKDFIVALAFTFEAVNKDVKWGEDGNKDYESALYDFGKSVISTYNDKLNIG